MGTQQILLIVLSVIIVGVAIAVGITMFQNQSYNSNKTAVVGELQQYAAQVIQWYKTPVSQGGAGSPTDISGFATTAIGSYIGFATDDTASNTSDVLTTETGTYTITKEDTDKVVIKGVGKEMKNKVNPHGVTTITFPDCTINTVITDGTPTT